MIVSKRLQLRIQIQREKRPRHERLRGVSARERCHGEYKLYVILG